MPSIRDLEDLIIDAIYLNLLRGKLDQKEQQLEVEYTMGRDLKPGQIEGVLAALRDWFVFDDWLVDSSMMLKFNRTETTQRVLQALDTSLSSLASQKAASAMELEEHERIYNANVKEILDRHKESKMASPMPMGRRGLSSLNGSQGIGQALGQALGGLMPGEGMDVDEPESKGKSRRYASFLPLSTRSGRWFCEFFLH
jgi:COP9 signalosome complex subunit 7